MVEDAGAADIIAGGRLQLGSAAARLSRSSTGFRYFGYAPPEGKTDADMAASTRRPSFKASPGPGLPSPTPLRCSRTRRDCFARAAFAGLRDRNLVGRRLTRDGRVDGEAGLEPDVLDAADEDAGVPFHELQAEQNPPVPRRVTAAGHPREPRVSVSRSIFALVDDRDRAYFGRGNQATDQVGYIDAQTKAIFGRSYAAEPDVLVKELAGDTANPGCRHAAADRPNQLGVEYNAHAIESILRFVARSSAGGKRARRPTGRGWSSRRLKWRNGPPGMRARETLVFDGPDDLESTFELAMPGGAFEN